MTDFTKNDIEAQQHDRLLREAARYYDLIMKAYGDCEFAPRKQVCVSAARRNGIETVCELAWDFFSQLKWTYSVDDCPYSNYAIIISVSEIYQALHKAELCKAGYMKAAWPEVVEAFKSWLKEVQWLVDNMDTCTEGEE